MSVTTSAAMKRPPIATVREWTIALGILTAGQMTRAEAEMKLRAYVTLLQDNFPAGAFTQDSLHHVASQCKWFPSYAEVVEHLRDWWHDRRPAPVALPAPPPAPPRPDPTPEEIAHVQAVVREVTAALRASAAEAEIQSGRLDVATAHRPRAAHLAPAQLDQINPLPNGRKRTDASTTTADAALSPSAAAPVDPDTA